MSDQFIITDPYPSSVCDICGGSHKTSRHPLQNVEKNDKRSLRKFPQEEMSSPSLTDEIKVALFKQNSGEWGLLMFKVRNRISGLNTDQLRRVDELIDEMKAEK